MIVADLSPLGVCAAPAVVIETSDGECILSRSAFQQALGARAGSGVSPAPGWPILPEFRSVPGGAAINAAIPAPVE